MVVGVGTEVIAGEGKIITAGAIDTHVHFICPQLVHEAIASGITTVSMISEICKKVLFVLKLSLCNNFKIYFPLIMSRNKKFIS